MDKPEFAAHRFEPGDHAERPERNSYAEKMLFRALNGKSVVAFVGAGTSATYGLPDWQNLVKEVLNAAIADNERPGTIKTRLSGLQDSLASWSRSGNVDLLTFILDECDLLLSPKVSSKDPPPRNLREIIADLLERKERDCQSRTAAYESLLRLPIRRFVTTNYDLLLENRIEREKSVKPEYFHQLLPTDGRKRAEAARLANVAAPSMGTGNPYLVFHCHGMRSDPKSLIVTDTDYRDWYLSAQKEGSNELHQTLNVLWACNPLLFVGFGLRDDDLLRPLRLLRATAHPKAPPRPLFALLDDSAAGDAQWARQLERRFGVHIITFPRRSDHERPGQQDERIRPEQRSKALVTALDDLCKDWEAWRVGIRQKPMFRRPDLSPSEQSSHFFYKTVQPTDRRGQTVGKHLIEIINRRPRVIAMIGPKGSGKSWAARYAIEHIKGTNTHPSHAVKWFKKFYWNSYYARDLVSLLDRVLLAIKTSPPNREVSRVDDIVTTLADLAGNQRVLLVLDRVERFMVAIDGTGRGRFINPTFKYLIRKIVDRAQNPHVTLVLVGQLWPEELKEWAGPERFIDHIGTVAPGEKECADKILAWRVPASAYRSEEERETDPANVDIRALVRDNAFASQVATHVEVCDRKGLSERLAWTPSDKRVFRVIREVLYDRPVNGKVEQNRSLVRLLDQMSLLTSPTYERVLCAAGWARDELSQVLKSARDRDLIYEIATRSEHKAWSLHPSVRAYFAGRGVPVGDALNPLLLPSVGRHILAVEPADKEHAEIAQSLFTTIHAAAEDLAKKGSSAADHEGAMHLTRALLGMLRGRMEPLAASRWCNLRDYLRMVSQLGNLVKHLSDRPSVGFWLAGDRGGSEALEATQGVLMVEELLWLYSAIGLTYYLEGNIFDSLLLWQEALEIAWIINGETGSGSYLAVALCNLGAAYRQFGRLASAERYLHEALNTSARSDDLDHTGSIYLELGVLEQLRGNHGSEELLQSSSDPRRQELTSALQYFEKARGAFDRENVRGRSRVHFYRAEWYRAHRRLPEAERELRASRGLAEQGSYPDLVERCRIGQGYIYLDGGKLKEALGEFQRVAEEMRKSGVNSLVADAVLGCARVANELGDAETARRRAIEALSLASEGLLGLRITDCLVVLGSATVRCGLRDLGLGYLARAAELAGQQGYAVKKAEAEREYGQLSV